MTNSKWLRSALLGGVAVSVMATGAQASELSDLKAQLEALQSRVNTIETAPVLPAGVSAMTMSKGHGSNASWGNESARDAINTNSTRGYTISINPTADLPAPVTEITVYGYAKLDFTFGSETGGGVLLNMGGDDSYHGADESNEWAASAVQTRFGIKAKTDTAIGQIRSTIEGDFYGASGVLRARHAFGEWDMTPNWTLVAGQTWHTASLLPIGVSTIDFSGSAGLTYARSAQLSLAYKNGPITGLIGISAPIQGGADYPDIGGRLQYTASGGHELIVAASIGDDDLAAVAAAGPTAGPDGLDGTADDTLATPAAGSRSGTSWQVSGGANIRLGDMATITTGAIYGKGSQAARYLNQDGFANRDAAGNLTTMWGANIGVSMSVSEATTFNAEFGYSDQKESLGSTGGTGCAAAATSSSAGCVTDVMTAHANIMWRPVKQMRLGWEVQWGRNDYYVAKSNNVVKGHFGAWFFF